MPEKQPRSNAARECGVHDGVGWGGWNKAEALPVAKLRLARTQGRQPAAHPLPVRRFCLGKIGREGTGPPTACRYGRSGHAADMEDVHGSHKPLQRTGQIDSPGPADARQHAPET